MSALSIYARLTGHTMISMLLTRKSKCYSPIKMCRYAAAFRLKQFLSAREHHVLLCPADSIRACHIPGVCAWSGFSLVELIGRIDACFDVSLIVDLVNLP